MFRQLSLCALMLAIALGALSAGADRALLVVLGGLTALGVLAVRRGRAA